MFRRMLGDPSQRCSVVWQRRRMAGRSRSSASGERAAGPRGDDGAGAHDMIGTQGVALPELDHARRITGCSVRLNTGGEEGPLWTVGAEGSAQRVEIVLRWRFEALGPP